VLAFTCSEAVAVTLPSVPVMVWRPAMVAVQVARTHEPSGAIVNVVCAVASPSELLELSKA
jgi:hypothetical protein